MTDAATLRGDGHRAEYTSPSSGRVMTFALPDGCNVELEARRMTLAYGVDVRVRGRDGGVILTVAYEGP